MDVVTLGAALSIMKKMPDTAASSAAAAEDAADRAEEAASTLTIDDTLTKPGQPADSKAVGDTLAEKLDIADLPDTVNNANQLLSEKYVVDTEPYQYRPSGGQGADREFDTIVGGSVVWNQHSRNTRATTTTNGITFTNNGDGSITVDGTATAVATFNSVEQSGDTAQLNHVYLIRGCPSKGNYDTYFLQQPVMTGRQNTDSGAGKVYKHTSSATRILTQIYVNNGTTVTNAIFKPQLFDLTQMFGSEIADYIYSLEQATAGAGVAWFRKYFPNDYYEYNPGELMHVSGVSAHKTYDADENVIGNYPLDSSLTLRGIPKLVDGKLSFDGDVYKPDGTVERRYGIVDLGMLPWDSEEELVTGQFRVNSNRFSIGQRPKFRGNLLTTGGYACDYTHSWSSLPDGSIGVGNSIETSILRLHDTKYEGYTAADFKTAMSGVYLVYELATSTTEEAQSFQSPQILDPYGTEEYVTTSIVPVGHETKYPENLRAKIEGLPWNFANLIAPVEAEFKATRNYTSGSLFIVDNTLYKATANIANGGTITPNTNCTATTLAEIIAAL